MDDDENDGSDAFKPAGYSNTDTAEVRAVNTLEYLIDDSLVKKSIESRDKNPNVDGFIEPIKPDTKSVPFGRIYIQIKKLPEKYADRPRFQAKQATLSPPTYLNDPYILFVVDTDDSVAYWRHISPEFRRSLDMDSQQKSKVIEFPEENRVTGESTDYYNSWITIIEDNNQRISNYEEYEQLKEQSEPALGKAKPRFAKIQSFLDTYNGLLDREFSAIKEYKYPNIWKIGYVDIEYEEDYAEYGLYPIERGENDVMIKEIDSNTATDVFDKTNALHKKGVRGNRIHDRPVEYAVEEIEDLTEEVIEKRQLSFGNSSFLAKEFIFSFIDEYHDYMNLPEKDRYSLSEVENGFYSYLQLWIDEAVKRLSEEELVNVVTSTVSTTAGFKLEMMDVTLSVEQKEEIASSVEARVEAGEQIGHRYVVGSFKTTPNLFPEALSVLKDNSEKEIERPYEPHSYELSEGESARHWDMYSDEEMRANFETFFNSAPKAYQAVVTENFPEIQTDLSNVNDEPLSLVCLTLDDGPHGQPSYDRFWLQSLDDRNGGSGTHILSDDSKIIQGLKERSRNQERGTITYNGAEYVLSSFRWGVPNFIFEDTPVLDWVYDTLEEQLTEYFESSQWTK